MNPDSPYLKRLKNRINLRQIPFTERSSRLLVYRSDDHLEIRLGERWFKHTQQLSAYRQRAPIIDNLCLTDENGSPIELKLTTYPDRLDIQTALGNCVATFFDPETLLIILPPGKCGLSFNANVDTAQTDRRGGVLRVTGDIRRNIAYTTNARILKNQIVALESGWQRVSLIVDSQDRSSLLLNITPRLGFNRYISDPFLALDASTRRWHEWFAAVPAVADPYQDQYYFAWWIMRAGLISTRYYVTREALTPSKFYYLGVWQWDAYFHALAYRYIDNELAQNQLRILLDHQRADGMLPDAVHDEGIVTHLDFPIEADVTKPPLIAWAAWKLFEYNGDKEFLDELYEPLVRWNRWWFEKNDLDHNGLCEYQHPFSSGLDDSPLWDEGMPVESPDLNTYLYLQQEALGKIAGVIGETQDSLLWQQRADDIANRMIQVMWDERAGMFWASRNKKRIKVCTPFNLFPLITSRMPQEITQRLVTHLTDEKQFWSPFPVPTVALNDPKFNPNQMWRGPTWININYLLIEGLQRCGYSHLAAELRQRTLEMVSNQTDIYEYYNPLTGESPPKAAPIYGWSSAIFIELAIQETKEIWGQ